MRDFEPNPRVRLGDNGGPIDPDFDPDFISARIIERAAQYLQFRFGELDNILSKRKGKRAMVFRLVLSYSIRGLVPSESAARILGINRKTFGENQQRPEVWANIDSEEGRALDRWLEHVSQAVYHDASTNVEETERLLLYFADADPGLRKAEKLVKESERAAVEADRAEAELREKQRIRQTGALRTQLKGISNKDAIIAKHRGTKDTAERLTPEALAVLETLSVRASKGVKTLTSEVNAAGLKECLRLGLAQDAEPHLSKATDRAVSIMEFGGLVYLEAIALDLIAKPKRKAARA